VVSGGLFDDEDQLPSIEELTGTAGDPDATLEAARRSLGLDTPRRATYGGPPAAELREELGL
jgi:hypothetical protein